MYSVSFDFIHMRGMMTCFSDPRSILAKAYDAIAPGGYLEMQDSVFPMHCHDDTLEGTALDVWGKACIEAAIKIGRPWTNAVHYKRWMEELGFEDVREKIFECATSPVSCSSIFPFLLSLKELSCYFDFLFGRHERLMRITPSGQKDASKRRSACGGRLTSLMLLGPAWPFLREDWAGSLRKLRDC